MPPSSKLSQQQHRHHHYQKDAGETKLVQSFLKDLQDARQRRHVQKKQNKRRRSSDDDLEDPSSTTGAIASRAWTMNQHNKKEPKMSIKGNASSDGLLTSDERKNQKKTKKQKSRLAPNDEDGKVPLAAAVSMGTTLEATINPSSTVLFPHRYILAPMVGASELPFRLLCRKYGADVAYTPMLSAEQFVNDSDYAAEHCPLLKADAPLVAHFGCNDPSLFAQAATVAQSRGCVGCDLNLGCPQRTAYLGHYGSYLMDDPDVIVQMIQQAVQATHSNFPISVKIRLLETCLDTIDFCRRLCRAGVALIAIHGRHRACWERTSAGARDGPADLVQIAQICDCLQTEFPHVKFITNGNTTTWRNVQDNFHVTHAHGLMSAEGILDDPALFLPRHDDDNPKDDNETTHPTGPRRMVQVWTLEPTEAQQRKIDRLQTKLIKSVVSATKSSKANDNHAALQPASHHETAKVLKRRHKLQILRAATLKHTWMSLRTLQETARDPMRLCHEYLDWAQAFPTTLRTVIFHTRRMLKELLTKYQLMNECLQCKSVEQVRLLLSQLQNYREHPDLFVYDQQKAAAEQQALERRRFEDSKRKRYEERMVRKAKREGLDDLHFYLKQGAALPTETEWSEYQHMPREQVVQLWKERHVQHCLAHHLGGTCPRGCTCAFLHAEQRFASSAGNNKPGQYQNAFVENDEVAG